MSSVEEYMNSGSFRSLRDAGINSVEIDEIRYDSKRPLFANLESLEIRRELNEQVLFRSGAVLPPRYAAIVKDAVAFGSGAVYTGKDVIRETSRVIAMPNLSPSDRDVVPGTTVLLKKPGFKNYGHWLVEILPRVIDARNAYPDRQLKFAVPAHPGPLIHMRKASLSWLGVKQEDIVWISDTPVMFEELVIISTNSIHSHTHDASGVRKISYAAVGDNDKKPFRKIFVRRNPKLPRRLLNEDQIVSMLLEPVSSRFFRRDLR